MADTNQPEGNSTENEFAQRAEEKQEGLVAEFLAFLVQNKAWWMVPILLALVLIFVAAWLSSSAAAPFIYPLF